MQKSQLLVQELCVQAQPRVPAVSSSLVLQLIWAPRFISPESLPVPFADKPSHFGPVSAHPGQESGICACPPPPALPVTTAAEGHLLSFQPSPKSPATWGQFQDRWEGTLCSCPRRNHHGFEPGVISNRHAHPFRLQLLYTPMISSYSRKALWFGEKQYDSNTCTLLFPTNFQKSMEALWVPEMMNVYLCSISVG